MIVFTLSTGNKLGLGLVALVWIVFSLVVSMVIPRYRPGFPGKNLPAFLALCTLFFVAMLAAVFVFGKESKEAEANAAPETPAMTQTGAGGKVDLAAGKAAWDEGSCGGCHVLKAAGGKGAAGPDLDALKPDAATVQQQVENGGGGMPAYKGVLSAKQIADVSGYVAQVAGT